MRIQRRKCLTDAIALVMDKTNTALSFPKVLAKKKLLILFKEDALATEIR